MSGVSTNYGAEPIPDRVPKENAAVLARLEQPGSVRILKLSLGAVALSDIWFGRQRINPWLPQEVKGGHGCRGAALVSFAIRPLNRTTEPLESSRVGP